VKENRPDVGGHEAINGPVRVRGRWVVVAPVTQRGRAAIDLIERTHEGRDVDVIGLKVGGQTGMHVGKILQDGPVAGDAPQGGLSGVHVGIHQPRHQNFSASINDLVGLFAVQMAAYLNNGVAFKKQVRIFKLSKGWVHGQKGGILNECSRHGGEILSIWVWAWDWTSSWWQMPCLKPF
jgi:hypothetical protein